MRPKDLSRLVTLPWLAAAVVLLLMTRLKDESSQTRLALVGSAAICFSIGCLARTSLRLHELDRATAPTAESEPGAAPGP